MKNKIGIIVPQYLRENRLFQVENSVLNRDDILVPYWECRSILRDRGILLETADPLKMDAYDALVFFCHDLSTYLRAARAGLLNRCIYVAWEPPTVDSLHSPMSLQRLTSAFGRILTWDESLFGKLGIGKIRYAQANQIWEIKRLPFEKCGLLANISGKKSSNHPLELYSERMRVLRYFQSEVPEQLVMYGPGWDAVDFPSYRGMAVNKASAYANSRFALCFENMQGVDGYITEKIFDCFRAGIVPIYLGAPNICDYVPKGSFIPYDPKLGPESLLTHLCSITQKEYANILSNGRETMSLLSEGPFSPRAMALDLEDAMLKLKNQTQLSLAACSTYVIQLLIRNSLRRLRR